MKYETQTVGLSTDLAGFLMTPSCVGVDTLEGGNAIHMDLDRLLNLTEFSKAKSKALRPGLGNPAYKLSLCREQVESSPEEKVLGLFNKLGMTWQCALATQKASCEVGCKKAV